MKKWHSILVIFFKSWSDYTFYTWQNKFWSKEYYQGFRNQFPNDKEVKSSIEQEDIKNPKQLSK